MNKVKDLSNSELFDYLKNDQYTWIITGSAGFIGSNIALALLHNNQKVVGIDNFITGKKENLEILKTYSNFEFIENDLSSEIEVAKIIEKSDYILHQAAIGSVPRSLKEPILYNKENVNCFLNLLNCIRNSNVKGFVYASSSSVYGDDNRLPKIEKYTGNPLSPYAATKKINEIHSKLYSDCYDSKCIGLRYFNVFGPKQDPAGNYAAVIPKWISAFINNEDINVNGDGSISRDFCFIDNVIQINIRSALALDKQVPGFNEIYNVACGNKTSLNDLIEALKDDFSLRGNTNCPNINYLPPRKGDIQDSLADISKAEKDLGYHPDIDLRKSIKKTIDWYIDSV
tara:strand:- start:416 stop:1441 length:1026 start_codon:yes stop_codon:yes gene_type:complete